MSAKEKLEFWLGQLDDCNPDEIWKLIEAYVEEEHQKMCDDCNPRDMGFCDNCDERMPDEPMRDEGRE